MVKGLRSLGIAALGAVALLGSMAGPAGAQAGWVPRDRVVLERVAAVELPRLDLEALAREDAFREAAGEPFRFAVAYPTYLTPSADGTWDRLAAGTLRWRLRLEAPGAVSLNLGFSRFVLPEGAHLLLYAADGSRALPPYTATDNPTHGELWTPVVPGGDLVVELTVPEEEVSQVDLVLASVNQGYREMGTGGGLSLRSGACEVDVTCPQANGWQAQIRSVGLITIGGVIACSGAMVNNSAGDLRPFFLTAQHCGADAGSAFSVVVYWNYQNHGCRTPGSGASGGAGNGSLAQSQSGSTFRAAYGPTDFTLLELDQRPNPAWNVYWAGWSRGSTDPAGAVTIHHPRAEEKRISFENDPVQTTAYGGVSTPGDGTHIRVVDWDLGVTEPGSSGGPLFDPNHRIIGQLHGGFSACGNDSADWYGRFSVSWSGGGAPAKRLSDWLDPTGSGRSVLNGTDQGGGPAPGGPAAPSNLAATVLSATEVLLAWQDNSGNETELLVEAAVGAGGFALLEAVPANTTSFNAAALLPATDYRFRVAARNNAGTSAYSNVVSVTTDDQAPEAPADLQARSSGSTNVILQWQDVSGNETSFVVEGRAVARAGAGELVFLDEGFQEIASPPAGSSAYEVEGLEPSTTYNFRMRAENAAGASQPSAEAAATTWSTGTPEPCSNAGGALCFLGGRFRVETFWKNQHPGGASGPATGVPGTDKSGTFWFFNASNTELVVKMLDGTGINGSYWLFFGALSDVEYWIVVTDTETGRVTTQYNAPGSICGQSNLSAFPVGGTQASGPAPVRAVALPTVPTGVAARAGGACEPSAGTLCLLDGRFAVEVDWHNQRNGQTGFGTAVPDSTGDRTGFFWFFNAANIELVVKMLDGSGINGKFWFFYGALSDVEYDITVTDTATGAQAAYHNEPGNICGDADLGALDG